MFLALGIGLFIVLLSFPTGFFGVILLTSVFAAVYLRCYAKHSTAELDPESPVRRKAQKIVAKMFQAQANLWHDYEIVGLENLPKAGPALMIYYHGAFSMDVYYFISKIVLVTGRVVQAHVAPFLLEVPGLSQVLKLFGCFSGGRPECVQTLQAGNLVCLSPGGVREALFSDNNYALMWNSRRGFAAVALEAKVPIIPFFTENVREVVRRVETGKNMMRWLFERKHFCSVPVYGGFPVKLRTYIGEPIPYDPNITADELVAKVKDALENLIRKHQKLPGSISHALKQRWDSSYDREHRKCL